MSAPSTAAAAAGVSTLSSLGDHSALLRDAGSQSLVVLLFTSPWHPPCKQMRTVCDQLALQFPASKFAEVDAEAVADVTELYPVESVPTAVLLREGKVVGSMEGANAVSLTNLVTQHARATPAASAAAAATPAAAAASTPAAAAAAPAESKEELHARLAKLVSASPVMIFIKGTPDAPRCGFTKQLLALLREQGVEFGSFDILSDPAVREGLKSFSNWPTYPQLYLSGELVGGLDIVKEMVASGEFASAIPAGHIAPKVDEAAAAAALQSRLKSLISQRRVMLFMKGSPSAPQCGFSSKVVALLGDAGLSESDYGSFDVFSDQSVREGLKQLSNWPTYPQLYVDGELVGGLDVLTEMAQSGDLQELLAQPPPLEPRPEDSSKDAQ